MTTYTKRLMKAGGSLFVPVPNTAVELWGLERGAPIHLELTPDELRITPIGKVAGKQVQESDLEHFWQVMKEVEVRTSVEDEGHTLKVQFTGPDPEATRALVSNLRKSLPAMLSMLGVRIGDTDAG